MIGTLTHISRKRSIKQCLMYIELDGLSASPFLCSGVLYQRKCFEAYVCTNIWRKKKQQINFEISTLLNLSCNIRVWNACNHFLSDVQNFEQKGSPHTLLKMAGTSSGQGNEEKLNRLEWLNHLSVNADSKCTGKFVFSKQDWCHTYWMLWTHFIFVTIDQWGYY